MSAGKQFFTRKLVWKYTKGVGIFACVAHTISAHIGELVICSGPSMHPTIHDGDLVLAERLSISSGNIHRGDIVGCLSPSDSTQLLCKRVVAKEGDYVNSEFLPNRRIPHGHVFLEGDNTYASTDSRHFGPVPEGLVQIRLFLRIWPFNRDCLAIMAVNGVYIVMGEANTVVALLNKARRQYQLSHQPPSLEDTDPLMRNFSDLKEVLNTVNDLSDMNPNTYLSPFLDVIKAQNTNGPITEAALSSVAKFLTYGLIDASSMKAGNAVNSIADAVVHTKFIGGKSNGSDECVLFKILLVLRSLLLSPPGSLLSNEAVCNMMQSCFRIVFEQNLSPLLRKAAEAILTDTTQLIFTRLSTFQEDTRHPYIRYLVMNSKSEKRRHRAQEIVDSDQEEGEPSAQEHDHLIPEMRKGSDAAASQLGYDVVAPTKNEELVHIDNEQKIDDGEVADSESDGADKNDVKAKESRRRFSTTEAVARVDTNQSDGERFPYGLPCCRELLRFLIALVNPLDRANTESMVILGLNLITVALEAAADHLVDYAVLMPLIRDNLCRSLLQLLDTEKLPVLAATNRVCFLLFESLRNQLKFQLEAYFHKLMAVIRSEQKNASYEQKEMALESLVQLWRIPGLVNELYLNYDCDIYSSNVFEELTELLKDMSFPMAGLGTTSLLALDALLVVIDTIEENCVCKRANVTTGLSTNKQMLKLPTLSGMDVGKKIVASLNVDSAHSVSSETIASSVVKANRHAPSENIPLLSDVIQRKEKKRILAEGTNIFNKDPKQGINYLREKGIFEADVSSVVEWLRTNPQLDKKKIAEYICSRKNAEVLAAFVESFPFANTRLDEALRIFLESFRLPGEAAEISMVMQHFSEQWYKANNEPFNHVDAAFTLSYAIIMLNMDQHNPQVKRNQPPMTVDCFRRNLSGTNNGQDFNQDMIVDIYNAIKSEEIVMPAEQTGIVKENYLWKVLLRRGETTEGVFLHAPTGWNDQSLFSLIWGPTISALSYVFGKTDHDIILKRALNGYRKCASIAAFFGMENVFDNLVITLCKFSTFTMHEVTTEEQDMNRSTEVTHDTPAVLFGENHKAQEAVRVLFELVHKNGDILRESWVNMIHTLLALFQAHLLPKELTEVDDFVDEKGWVSIIRKAEKDPNPVRNEAGLLSWFGLGSGTSDAERRKLTEEQLNSIKLSKEVIKECTPAHIVRDSKYLTMSALKRIVIALREVSKNFLQQTKKRNESDTEHEDMLVFLHELIVSITLENKDRIAEFWDDVKEHIVFLLSLNKYPVLVERAVVGILRIANRNLFRDNSVADDVFITLAQLLNLSPKALFIFSRQISNGLHELLRNNAQDIHRKDHWQIIFSLMETTGAARVIDDVESTLSGERNAYSDVERPAERLTTDDRGYTSDNYLDRANRHHPEFSAESRADSAVSVDQSKDWIHLDKKDADKAIQDAQRALFDSKPQFNRPSLVLRTHLGRHEPAAFLKICDCLDFLLRESAPHITPENLESSISCLLSMVEASLDGGRYAAGPLSGDAQSLLRSNVDERRRHKHSMKSAKKELSTDVPDTNSGPSDEQQLSASYQQVSLHLLDLCSNLHSCAFEKLAGWAREDSDVNCDAPYVWSTVWMPLLQVMARLACDCRRRVREIALAQLQRSFLNMTNLGAEEWESCFNNVLFPLLSKLLEPFSAMDPLGREDTRVRAIQIVAKTLLNRLKELSSLPTFSTLWLRLLDYMEKYLRIDTHGTLSEAVPESLKNMLLVLDNSGLFMSIPGLYELTKQRINPILPQLIRDTIPNPPQTLVPAPKEDVVSLASSQSSRIMGRVQIASALPAEQPAVTQPVEIPEIPLTEVVVHSGASSPTFAPPVPHSSAYELPRVQSEMLQAQHSRSCEPATPSSSSVSETSTAHHYPAQQSSSSMTYGNNMYYQGYSYNTPQTSIPPLHMSHYANIPHQPIMPQADLSKAFAGGQPQFIPPQELLQSSYNYSQNFVSNPLPIPHHQPQQFMQSSTSAFQPIAPDQSNNGNQGPFERP